MSGKGAATQPARLAPRPGWTEADWDRMVASRPEGTLFHTRAWARLVLASFPSLRDVSVWLEGEDCSCVLPLFRWERARGLMRTLQSSFPFHYGGAIPARTASGADLSLAALEALRHPLCSWRVTGNPFLPPDGAAEDPLAPRGFFLRSESTQLLRLPETEEAYWETSLSTAQRNDVRRLERKGVQVEESRDPKDVDAVYRIYLDSFARWGGRPGVVYPRRFYQNLLRLGGETVRFTVARVDGRILGGTFTLRWNGKAHYLAGYFDHASRAFRPNVLIQVESIRRAIRDGFVWYDFLPSHEIASVEEFKASFGGKRVTYPVWTRRGALHRLLRRGQGAA